MLVNVKERCFFDERCLGYECRDLLFYKIIKQSEMHWLFLWCIVPAFVAVSSGDDYNQIYIANSNSISMSRDGSVYSAIDNGINYYRKINNTYTLITKFYPLCTSTGLSCSATKQVMTYDGSRILAYSSNDNFIRVYKIVNDTITHAQQIAATGTMQARFQVKEDYLLLSSTTAMQYYLYDNISGLYQLIYSGNYPATQLGATFSTDGKYVLTYSSTLSTYIYSYDGTTFAVPATSTQIPLVNGSITQVYEFKVEQFNSTTYFIVISFTASLTGTNRQLHYYTFNAAGINFAQQIDQSTYYLYTVYMTKTAKYLAQGITPFSIKLYELDTATRQYVLVFHSYNFVTNYPSNIYITEDGSFLYGNIGSQTTFFFKCTLSYCSKCLSLNQCLQCKSTFTLSSTYTCACSSTQTLLNSSCINCNITKCSSCSANNTCSGCAQGFSLVSNACVCQSGSTISYLDGSCVSCNVNSCSRCDQANVCALYDSKQTKDMQEIKDRLSNNQKIIVGLLAVVLTLIILGIVYFLLKAKQIIDSMPKVGSEPGMSSQQQNPTDKADTIALENAQAPSFQFNEQVFDTIADLQVKKSKVRRKNKRNYDQTQLQNISLQKFMDKGES